MTGPSISRPATFWDMGVTWRIIVELFSGRIFVGRVPLPLVEHRGPSPFKLLLRVIAAPKAASGSPTDMG